VVEAAAAAGCCFDFERHFEVPSLVACHSCSSLEQMSQKEARWIAVCARVLESIYVVEVNMYAPGEVEILVPEEHWQTSLLDEEEQEAIPETNGGRLQLRRKSF
jgi:hypothetical protein